MDDALDRIYDLAVVGGGITGAGILREAGRRGYTCLLVEKGDFGSGTSSRSSKLVHGGLRYLTLGHIGLVRRCLKERNELVRTFPDRVRPIPYLFPLSGMSLNIRLILWLYGRLGRSPVMPGIRILGRAETLAFLPGIDARQCTGSVLFHEAVTHDAALCNEVVLEATADASVRAFNYCQLTGVDEGPEGLVLRCVDKKQDRPVSFRSRILVNASGPWVDEVSRLTPGSPFRVSGPSKGVHILIRQSRWPIRHVVIFPSGRKDGRRNFALPWEHGSVIIGTTDTPHDSGPDAVEVREEDIRYLLDSVNAFAPSLGLVSGDILSSWAGIRPLFDTGKATADRRRDYRVWWSHPRVVNMFGGKLTSFLSMATDLMDDVERQGNIAPSSGRRDNSGSLRTNPDMAELPEARERLHPDWSYCQGDLRDLVRDQNCEHLSDLLYRRWSIGYVLHGHPDLELIVRKAARWMGDQLGWDDDRVSEEIQQLLRSARSGTIPG